MRPLSRHWMQAIQEDQRSQWATVPDLEEYAGRGPLTAWTRVAAIRALSNRTQESASDATSVVHRSTAARWISTARDALIEHTRRLLADELQVWGRSLQETLAEVHSQ
jgi:hypothetical protein